MLVKPLIFNDIFDIAMLGSASEDTFWRDHGAK